MARKLLKKNTKVQKIVKKVVKSPQTNTQQREVLTLKGEYIEAVGRRKVATARVRLFKQKGDFIVNGKAAGQYFHTVLNAPTFYNQPLQVVGVQGDYGVSAHVKGSGANAQLDAVRLGLARALVKMNPDWKPLLKAEGLLTRDDRMKETRKIGMGGKARRKRQSPKR